MRWRLVIPFAVLAGVIVLVAALIAGTGETSEAGDDAPATVTTDTPAPPSIPSGALGVDVGGLTVGRAIPPGFLGFSIEYTALLPYAGSDPRSLNPTFLALVRNLNPGQSPVIRIGGDTTDWSWWPTPGVRTPPGVTYTITDQWLQVAHAMAAALGARLIPGLQFEDDSRRVAAAEANAMLKTIGRKYIAAFELGNEPEVYAALGWYHTAAGVQVPGRKPGYDVRLYNRDFSSVSSALPHAVPLAGPASGAGTWLAGVGRFAAEHPRVKIATFHRYALSHCTTNPRSPYYSTISHLMEPRASAGLADSLAPAVTAAHAHHLSFRVDELNSVSCRGGKGVSDTFASSLWALDTLFDMARVGVDGVNIHTLVISSYMPFTFSSKDGRWSAQVKPLYYGLLMFARAAPPGSRLLPTSGPPSSGPVHTWATRAPDGTVRVVLINDSRQRTVAVAAPGSGSGTATLTRLVAPGLAARSAVTLGGQSFGSSTSTGELGGTPHVTTLHPLHGRYVVALPSASAAMLTIQAG